MAPEAKLWLYLDTSVFSAFYDQRSPERMKLTQQFWRKLPQYGKLCSHLTLEELRQTKEQELRRKLLALTQEFSILQPAQEEKALAKAYVQAGVVPSKYFADALHIALAVLGGADILVSWNFQHLVKRSTRLLVNYVNATKGLRSIEILAPPEI